MADDKIATFEDLRKAILDRAGIDDPEQKADSFLWHGHKILVEAPSPFNDKMLVVAMFQDETEVRLYEAPNKQPAEGEKLHPRRLTLSKAHKDVIFTEVMSLVRFADLIANEWSELDAGFSTAERERAAVLEYLASQAGASDLMAAIERGDHLEVEEDEEDEAPDGATLPAPPPAATAETPAGG